MELNLHHPAWYRLILALNEYRKSNYREAVAEAVKANRTGIWADLVLGAAYGQLGELAATHDSGRNLAAVGVVSVESARELLAKWFDAELTEHVLDGLRKAGLEIAITPER